MVKLDLGSSGSAWLRAAMGIAIAIGALIPSGLAQDTPAAQEPKPPAADAQAQVTIETIRKLIRELEAKTLKDRNAAEKSLIELGATVLTYLPEVDANTSGEMKVRLQRIRQQLQSVDIEAFFEASKVTLLGKMPVAAALSKITEQTGNKITLEGEGAFENLEVELAETDSPFWSVMEKLMAQGKLRVNTFSTSEGLSLGAGAQAGSDSMPQSYSTGPFRIDVASVQSSLPFNSRLGGQLDLALMVSWEPRLKPIFMQIPMASVQATASDGKTLAASSPQSVPEVPLNSGGCSTQIDLQLERPARAATSLSKLTGEFVFAVPGEKHKYIFKKFGNGARQSEKFGEVSVTLEGARSNGSVYEMRVLIEFGDAQGALDSFRGWILSNEAYLLDPKERRLENVGLQTYAITPNAIGIAYLFQINGNPDEFQLVYESPVKITRQTVKYELQNIELP